MMPLRRRRLFYFAVPVRRPTPVFRRQSQELIWFPVNVALFCARYTPAKVRKSIISTKADTYLLRLIIA
jgi:hypothetical protein